MGDLNQQPTLSMEELQKQIKDLQQKLDGASRGYRELQSRTDREREEMRRQMAELQAELEGERQEFLRLAENQPEVKANYELAQLRAKASQYDRMQEDSRKLSQYKQQLAGAYGLNVEDLAEAKDQAEAFTLARRLERQRLAEELRQELGLKKPEDKKEEDAEGEPPDVPISRGPAPDSTLATDAEWEKQRKDAAQAARNPQASRRDREAARLDFLKRSRRPDAKPPRARV